MGVTSVIVKMLCLVVDIAVYIPIIVGIGNKPYKTKVFERETK